MNQKKINQLGDDKRTMTLLALLINDMEIDSNKCSHFRVNA